MTRDGQTEFLFSYGTLQLERVQRTIFGKPLTGQADALEGFVTERFEVADQEVLAVSGEAFHTMATHTGQASDVILGTVFPVTAAEIQAADRYEVSTVRRVAVRLRSGVRAWAYVDARYVRIRSQAEASKHQRGDCDQ